jgi:hypothetical protein
MAPARLGPTVEPTLIANDQAGEVRALVVANAATVFAMKSTEILRLQR